MNKTKLNIGIVNAAGIRVNPNLIVGDTGSYSSGDILDANAVEAIIQFKSGMPETYKVGDDGQLYYIKDNGFYPVSHPDLSTQPSVLSQRFGNLDIKEVLIANGRENEIPSDAMVIEAWSFNKTQCVSAFVQKDGFRIEETWKYPFEYLGKSYDITYPGCVFEFPIGINDIPVESYGNIMIKFKEYDFWCSVGQHIHEQHYKITLVGQPEVMYGSFSRQYNAIYIDSEYTVESVHYTGERIQVKQKIKGWSISNDKGVVPDFTLVRYVGEQNDYYYTSGVGGVTPIPLTPNFEFPITAVNLGGKTMTASSPIAANDLVNGLKLNDSQSRVWNIVNRGDDLYFIAIEDESLNPVQLGSDGLTITFGTVSDGPTFTGFTFNA